MPLMYNIALYVNTEYIVQDMLITTLEYVPTHARKLKKKLIKGKEYKCLYDT